MNKRQLAEHIAELLVAADEVVEADVNDNSDVEVTDDADNQYLLRIIEE